MRETEETKNKFSDLRRKAEDEIQKQVRSARKEAVHEMEHELNVHKVELEMQNEELRNTQCKLQKAITDFTELFEMAPIGYFILDRNGVIVNLNTTACTLLGTSKNKLVKKPFSTFLTTEFYQDNFYRHRNMVVTTEKVGHIEGEIRRKDSSVFPAHITSTLVKDEQQEFKHFLMMVRDISEQKDQEEKVKAALEKEIKLNELKSRFITTASHEFRTPLAIILLSTELLETYNSSKDQEKRTKHYYKIKSAVQGLSEILLDFLSLDKFENGLILNNPEPVKLVPFIEHIIEEINLKKQPLVFNHIGDRDIVHLDPRLLKVCIGNVIGNALKYSPPDGLVTVISETNGTDLVTITVQDEGIGIAEYDKPYIFDQFFRASNAETYQGTGLGLNIVHKFIAIMEGSISFSSTLNHGSTFVLTFKEKNKAHQEKGAKEMKAGH
jgi:two-component system, LuxR family, sensor kinase FixL